MAKREFAHPNEMHKYVGQEIGVSDWVEVTQARIDQFAEATGDHQWIHVDVERAKTDMPGGKTIAHGFLTLSLIPMLNHQISHINNVRNGINYGCNKVRFTNPVQAGSRVRARAKLIGAEPMKGGGVRLTNEMTIEIEGQEKPACVAETMSIVYGT
jgi:acyl dehydratase